MRLSVQQASVITVWIVFCATCNYAPAVRPQQENILFLILEVAENQAGCKLTNHNKIQLFRQRHSHVSTVFFKGFYSSTQCGSGTYIIVLCFLRWDYQEVCAWQVRNRILPCCGLIYTSLVPNRAWEEGYRPLTHHPLTRRNCLVNQVEFLGLAHTFATLSPSNVQNISCQTHSKMIQMLEQS